MGDNGQPRYYHEGQAKLRDALIPSFGAAEAIGKLMVAAARGHRAAKELLALRKKWAKEQGEAPDHLEVHALDYLGIKELARGPVLNDRELEALGMLLQKVARAQADSGLAWELNRMRVGKLLETLAVKLCIVAEAEPDPVNLKKLVEELAEHIETTGRILEQTSLWEEPGTARMWKAIREALEAVDRYQPGSTSTQEN